MIEERLNDILHGMYFGMHAVMCAYFFLVRTNAESPRRVYFLTGLLSGFIAFTSSVWIFDSLLIEDKSFVSDPCLGFMVNASTVPFLCFVIRQTIRVSRFKWKRVLIEAGIPILLAVIYHQQLLWNIQGCYITYWIYLVYIVIYIVYYLHRYFGAYKRYEKLVIESYADIDGRSVNWTRRMLIIFFVLVILFFCLKTVFKGDVANFIFMASSCLLWLAIYWHVNCMRDNHFVPMEEDTKDESADYAEGKAFGIVDELTQLATPIRDKTAEKIRKGLIQLMEEEKMYCNPDLNIEDVSNRLNTNRSYVSYILNSEMDMNFHRFVNSYRVEHAKLLLARGDDKLTVIAAESGFNSPETMNRIFKSFINMSPAAFRSSTLED